MLLYGRVLWWDTKDQNGIIVDTVGNEFYFDISVVVSRKTSSLKPGKIVQFKASMVVQDVPCAEKVIVPPAKSHSRLKKEFERQAQMGFEF